MKRMLSAIVVFGACAAMSWAGAGDVQTKTDHPWYGGELSCSTFGRLFQTQADVFARETGKSVQTDEDKALASWYWRSTHFVHGIEGKADLWDQGFGKGGDAVNREYWTGLFSFGMALCGHTHGQWNAEMTMLLGPTHSRTCGVVGHNAFEVWLTGGAYGSGRWALLDQDEATVIFTPDGSRLVSIGEIVGDFKNLTTNFPPERQHGWPVRGFDHNGFGVYTKWGTAEYAAGYAAAPPMVYLRAGETLRRYLKPGLDDGKTFAFWGFNYMTGGIPGPACNEAWVDQPERFYAGKRGEGKSDYAVPHAGQFRYGNAVYTYKPDFAGGTYKEGAVEDAPDHVTFEFYSPYVIACTPSDMKADKGESVDAVYRAGGKNGLVITGKMTCPVSVSTDQGKTWSKVENAADGMDLTDRVKGHYQYWIRFDAPAKELAAAGLSIRTVCQANAAIIPHVKAGKNQVTYLAGGTGVVSAGPNKDQAQAHVVDGALGTSKVTLELASPRQEKAVHIYAASWQDSGCPPKDCLYQVEYSTDGGKTWSPVARDWKVERRQPDPADWWSQSLTFADAALDNVTGPVRVRFTNDGKVPYLKAEAHLVYQVSNNSPVKVTYAWTEEGQPKQAENVYPASAAHEDASWSFTAGENPQTVWVEYAAQ